jgi:hypothetical protein
MGDTLRRAERDHLLPGDEVGSLVVVEASLQADEFRYRTYG